MDEQTRKAYWQTLSWLHSLDEKISHLNEDEVKIEEAIYSIPPEKDYEGIWEEWSKYIENKMAARLKLERIMFKARKVVEWT